LIPHPSSSTFFFSSFSTLGIFLSLSAFKYYSLTFYPTAYLTVSTLPFLSFSNIIV
jgi:hypothetical protein